jgi:hypothetical protein
MAAANATGLQSALAMIDEEALSGSNGKLVGIGSKRAVDGLETRRGFPSICKTC